MNRFQSSALVCAFFLSFASFVIAQNSRGNPNIQWEQINGATESRFAIFRTPVPEGWLVSIGSGTCAVIVKDPEHVWGQQPKLERD